MIGDLSLVLPSGLDQGSGSTSALRDQAGRTAVRARAVASVTASAPQAADPRHLELGRLKALLTDPGMRVGTHRDDASGRVVMRVEDRATGELVEQIPSEELLRLYAALREPLIDEEA